MKSPRVAIVAAGEAIGGHCLNNDGPVLGRGPDTTHPESSSVAPMLVFPNKLQPQPRLVESSLTVPLTIQQGIGVATSLMQKLLPGLDRCRTQPQIRDVERAEGGTTVRCRR